MTKRLRGYSAPSFNSRTACQQAKR